MYEWSTYKGYKIQNNWYLVGNYNTMVYLKRKGEFYGFVMLQVQYSLACIHEGIETIDQNGIETLM